MLVTSIYHTIHTDVCIVTYSETPCRRLWRHRSTWQTGHGHA